MKEIKCVLFDMDGVMIDTETQYDAFWEKAAPKYGVHNPDFPNLIKGTTLQDMLKNHFSHCTQEQLEEIIKESDAFETQMDYIEIPGAVRFVKELKAKGIKVGLVTSSTATKMVAVNEEKQFNVLFDTEVTASRVQNGKPDPECYKLAAQDLGFDPAECIVFEDAFAGIQAARGAGVKTVIGLATTNPADALAEKCESVISDFTDFGYEDLKKIL